MSDSDGIVLVLGAGVAAVAGYFSLRKNVNVKTYPLFTHVFVDGVSQGTASSPGLDLHLSGKHTISFQAKEGWNTPNPITQDFSIFQIYGFLGTYTPKTGGENLLSNPDFDDGSGGWDTEGPLDLTIEDSGTSEGPYAQLFVGSGDYGILSQTVDLPDPGAHPFIFSAYFTGTTRSPEIYVSLYDAAGDQIGETQYASLNTFTTSAFQLAEKEFITTSDTSAIKVSVVLNNSTGQDPIVCGVDKISLYQQ